MKAQDEVASRKSFSSLMFINIHTCISMIIEVAIKMIKFLIIDALHDTPHGTHLKLHINYIAISLIHELMLNELFVTVNLE